MARIIVVEDDELINELVVKSLTKAGHTCISAFDGYEAAEIISVETLDLAILDVMLPGESGFELISEFPNLPTIFLTAKSELSDRLKGLSLGADDYITKPFAMSELLARVQAVLRRTKRDENFFYIDDIAVDFDKKTVMKNGEEVPLSAKEFAVLDFLITNRNITLSREKIIDCVWKYDFEGDTTRVIDVYIQQLRKKLGLKDRIISIYGIGYRLEV